MIETYTKDHSYVKEILIKDALFESIVLKIEQIVVYINDDYYTSLVEMIIGQQLSAKVASIINQRLKALFETNLEPNKMLSFDDERLRSLGLSKQKIAYIRHLSTYYLSNQEVFQDLKNLSDEDVIKQLTHIKGIGRWTSEMFLIFSLRRYDVFSVLDLGLREAVKKLYNDPLLTNDEIIEIAKKWAPYRTIASHYLWHIWDNGINT